MHSSLIAWAGIAALVTSLVDLSGSVSARAIHVTTNPCLHGRDGYQRTVLDNARGFAADEDGDDDEPAAAENRAELGLVWWPSDSVHATTDSTVCSHLESLIAIWPSGAEAQSKNATRHLAWPGISVARLNPHKYLVAPPFHESDSAMQFFVVDSVSGSVQFRRGYTQ